MAGLDSLIENQGFYDYLNHLISGSVFIIGSEAIAKSCGISLIWKAYEFIGLLNSDNQMNTFLWNVCVISLWCIVAFLLGVIIQELYGCIYRRTNFVGRAQQDVHTSCQETNPKDSCETPCSNICSLQRNALLQLIQKIKSSCLFCFRLFNKTTIEKCMRNLFEENGPITNKVKLDVYRNLGNDFIKTLPSPNTTIENDATASCFFAHCVYYIQIKKQDKKTEKLRDIAGLSESLSFIFMIFAVASIVCMPFNIVMLLSYFIMFSIFSIVMDYRTEKAHKNRIRMTLAIYAVGKDEEAHALP